MILNLVLGGCEVVFPLHGPDPTNEPRCLAPGDLVELPLLADTYVDGTAMPHGAESSLQISNGRSILLKFDLGTLRVEDLDYSLTLAHPASANECGTGGCGGCPMMATGLASIALTRSDWDESSVTSSARSEGQPWSMVGPSGADTTSAASISALEDQRVLRAFFSGIGSGADPAWPTGAISVLLIDPGGGTTHFLSSRTNSCDPLATAPSLIATCSPKALCGNGVIDIGEQCDDRNSDVGDGCASTCTLEGLCGNGNTDAGEACDDGNTVDGDCCIDQCMTKVCNLE